MRYEKDNHSLYGRSGTGIGGCTTTEDAPKPTPPKEAVKAEAPKGEKKASAKLEKMLKRDLL